MVLVVRNLVGHFIAGMERLGSLLAQNELVLSVEWLMATG